MNLFFPITLGALAGVLLALAPFEDDRFEPNVRAAFTKKTAGEIVFFSDINFEFSRFVSDINKIVTMDASYGCLPEVVTRKKIGLALDRFDTTYITEARDCDDLALEFIVALRKSFRNSMGGAPLATPIGLADLKLVSDIPEMGYFLDGGVGYHAVVIVRCAGGKWLIVDPRMRKVSEFTGHLYEGTIELRRAIF